MLDLDEPVRSTLWRPQYRPELTKRPNFTYRVKIDISASVEKPQVANFRTTGQTDRVYRTVFKVSLHPQGIDLNPCRESCVCRQPRQGAYASQARPQHDRSGRPELWAWKRVRPYPPTSLPTSCSKIGQNQSARRPSPAR